MNGIGNSQCEEIKKSQEEAEKISDLKSTVIYFTIDKFAQLSLALRLL